MQYVARYGAMRLLGLFSGELPLRHGSRVVVRSSRGLEIAVVLCEATEKAIAKLDSCEEEGRILREATNEDLAEQKHLRLREKQEFLCCQRIVKQLTLEMSLVKLEHIFGGERIVVYYVAEGRIDFRELVKLLAAEFQTRIEMRQIGVRDETKLLADFGDCGKEVCCNTYLVEMPPVSMKMAKLQKATLDPTKISGRCGRLKCCLRFEYDVYVEMQDNFPPIGAAVETPHGRGKVISHEILAQRIWVDFGDLGKKPVFLRDLS